LGYFKFHGLFFAQGAEAVALDGAVMHEDIGAVFPADKTKALGVIKPFNRTIYLHLNLFLMLQISRQKSRAHSSQAKKIGREDLATRPIIVQDSRPGFQSDMLTL
jgi:hypothetical protein